MDVFLLILRLILAGVLSVAALGKLFDRKGSEEALAGFGITEILRRPIASFLPIVEIAVALGLLFVSTSWVAAGGAAVLFIVFLGGMFYHMAKGNAPDCHCFGQIHNEPVGISSVARNMLLLAMAGFLLGQGSASQGLGLVNNTEDVPLMVFGLGILSLLGIIAFYLFRISRQQQELLQRIDPVADRDIHHTVERDGVGHPTEGLPIGAKFPNFELPGINGKAVTLDIIKSAKKPALFFFISPTCTPCEILAPDFESWQTELRDKVNIVFVTNGTAEANLEKFGSKVGQGMMMQRGRELADRAKAKWTPTALLVDAHGRVVSHAAAGDTAIRDLVDRIRTEDLSNGHAYFALSSGPETRNKAGQKIPEFSARDINGNLINERFFNGKPTLVAFWGLDCGHCRHLLEEFRKWDSTRRNGDPNLIVFSDGDPVANGELGFKAPVIIDPGYRIAAKFGMFGTPSAVLVDENQTIISETAIGAAQIWALIGREN